MFRDGDGGGGPGGARGAGDPTSQGALEQGLRAILAECADEHASDAGELLHRLSEFLIGALAAEEARIRGAHPPGAEAHLREHGALRTLVGDLVKVYARYGNEPRVIRLTRNELGAWLDAHAPADRAFREHERAAGRR